MPCEGKDDFVEHEGLKGEGSARLNRARTSEMSRIRLPRSSNRHIEREIGFGDASGQHRQLSPATHVKFSSLLRSDN